MVKPMRIDANTPDTCPMCGYSTLKVHRGFSQEVTRTHCGDCDWKEEYKPWKKPEK